MPTAGTYQAQGVGTDLDGYAEVRTGAGINFVTNKLTGVSWGVAFEELYGEVNSVNTGISISTFLHTKT